MPSLAINMAPVNRIIIDTDPGVDDVIAILLALSAKPEELEVLLFSVVSGNTSVEKYVYLKPELLGTGILTRIFSAACEILFRYSTSLKRRTNGVKEQVNRIVLKL